MSAPHKLTPYEQGLVDSGEAIFKPNAPQPSKHAMLGPSSAYKWMTCPGSIALEQKGNYKDSVGNAAKAGTFMHHVAAMCLEQHKNAIDFSGYKETVEGVDFTFDKDHAGIVQIYLNHVWTYVGHDGELFIEQELDISWLTGEKDAVGTADAIVVRNGELVVIDLKTGNNAVSAVSNHQLVIYSMAALKAYNEGKLTKSTPPGPFYWWHPESSSQGIVSTRAELESFIGSDLVEEISAEKYAALLAEADDDLV